MGNSPLKFSLFSAFLIAVIALLVGSASSYFFSTSVNIYGFLFTFLLIFLCSSAIIYLMTNRYIKERITPIYKAISKLKKNKFTSNTPTSHLSEPLMDEVEREVISWAKDRNKEIEDLKSMEAFRREYVGNVSHELKTPIFNVQGYIYTLLEGGIDDDRIRLPYLEKAAANVDRLQNIIQDLEIISTLESSTENLEMHPFDLSHLVNELAGDFKITATEKDIQIKLSPVFDKPITVLGDKEKIRQVFTNLISNSLKYGKKGGKTKISAFEMDAQILIEVEDEGIGMDEEHLGRVFERFYRVDKGRSRDIGGTGLGLSIVKHILEKHNQTIDVRSVKDEGSTFSFTLEKV